MLYDDIKEAYTNDDIQDDFISTLTSNVTAQYSSSGFAIEEEDISDSQFVIVNGTIPTTTIESEEEDRELWAFINFDFENYTTQDWIIFGGIILLIITLCACFCYCMNKIRRRNIPDSAINAKTGRTRVSLFEIVTNKQVQHKQKSLGFDAAIAMEPAQSKSIDASNPETEMQPVEVYKSNYKATPMKAQWNRALTAAADTNAFEHNISEDDDETRTHKSQLSQVSFGGNFGQSFGGPSNNTNVFQPNAHDQGQGQGQGQIQALGSLHEDEEEEEDEDQYDNNVNTISIVNHAGASGVAPTCYRIYG